MKPEVGHWDVLIETYSYLGPSHLIAEIEDEKEKLVRTKCGLVGHAVGWSPDVQQCPRCLTAMRADLNTVIRPREHLADLLDRYEKEIEDDPVTRSFNAPCVCNHTWGGHLHAHPTARCAFCKCSSFVLQKGAEKHETSLS